ncbi:1,4-dihydroxy-2-naphthoate octaprenyltransferase [Ammoniphilus resinae]|uniref:1,4-dihydroxy-2-naphthoate octaprenyltransferase n=1 Tax=Ammoniphilus resinae TaxID=861532 RepID=A0ABS4GM89_9BACL|nr:1,4-dihydroxy-2-naphthoate octaprenyltransferase [Ammoniphilus resinae]MBP1931364.1 1,4-dihydroxy-2-naphthoate octaprenyltransferase [Ammoniphilus resinae]
MSYSKEQVLEFLNTVEIAAIGTSNMGSPRIRMMHFAVDEDFNIYVSSMKGDPKIIQWVNIPETAILMKSDGTPFVETTECEIIGRAEIVKTEEERAKAIELVKVKSPIVANFDQVGALDRLDFIKIVPSLVKYRYVPDILNGHPPTIFTSEEKQETKAWADVKARARAWKEAVRPLSLTASSVPVILGGAMAYALDAQFNFLLFVLTFIGAVMIQAGTNIINDWKDAERDAQNIEGIRPFTGGSRVIQMGLISKAEMGFVGILLSTLAALIGIYLVFASGWGLIPLVIFGLAAGVFYTGGKGKFSFINMGPGIAEGLIATAYGILIVLGTYYVQTHHYSLEVFLVSLPLSLFIVNVLLINQFQDANSDIKSDKKTLVVRIGRKSAKNVLIALFIIGYLLIAILPTFSDVPNTIYLGFLSLPFTWKAIKYANLYYDKQMTDLVPSNAHTAITHLFNGLLLALAYLWVSTNMVVIGLYIIATVYLVLWVWRYIERQRRVMNSVREAFNLK